MINRVVLVGRLTRDPELRRTQEGTAVANFTIAVDDRFNKENTNFFNCVAWGKTAEFVSEYIKKGHLVGVDGRLAQRTYENNSGQKVVVVEIIAEQVQSYQPRETEQTPTAAPSVAVDEVDDDDLPF